MNNFRKIGKGLYTDEKGNIGRLAPTGRGGWYIKSLDEVPDVAKRAGKFERKQKIHNELTEEIKYLKHLEGKVSKQNLDDAVKTTLEHYQKRLKGKDTITDIPEAYRHYEKDYENELRAREYGYSTSKLPEEKDYLPGGKKWNKEWESARETKFSKKEPSFLKGATKEEKENYYRNLAEKQKMEKMGTTEYLMEKQRERGDYKDEKVNNLQTKARNVIEGMANDRIKEKENTLANDKAMLEGMKRKGINEVQGFTQKDFENRINKNEEYLKIAKGEAFQNKNGAVVEIRDIDDKGQTTYSIQSSPTTPPSYYTHTEDNVKRMLELNEYEKVGKALKSKPSLYEQIHNEYTPEETKYIIGRDNNDISPMSEYSDTTGTGYSDKQTKELSSGAYDVRTSTELRKQLKALEPHSQELQVGDRVIISTGGGKYGVRNKDDFDDPMTDYSAYVYGFNAKSIIDRAREKGIVVDKPKKTSTEAKIERFKQRKQGATIDTMSKRELAEKIVENQISRGMNFTNKEEIIKDKMRMSKSDLLKYFK